MALSARERAHLFPLTLRIEIVVPAGPEQRQRPVIALRNLSGLRIASALSAADRGFSLHAATTASADDAAGREALCKCILRPRLHRNACICSTTDSSVSS